MPDNTILNPGVGGDVARSIDRAGVKTQVVAIDLGGEAGPENLLGDGGMPITATEPPLPTGAATDLGLAAVVTALGTPLQAGGSVAVSNFPATQPVSGTFWQATQPVSFTWAGLTDAQLRAAAVPVSGTFWQATQPVSFTWAGPPRRVATGACRPLWPPAHRSAMTKPAALKPPAAPGATCNEP